ncbi:hypothetical protein AVEN_118564-1 [Araneus ventricosus]|uniref:Uncharacterized protein n=1 Tax=Araneus ventricosus TaxID=182803 RepID=A0A4Y2AWP5_ARAVE|nr:hypothetical protein AVEN_118564-1 [Araneus ventricosus]
MSLKRQLTFLGITPRVPHVRIYIGIEKEEYEEWMPIDENIPVAATLMDLEICQAICEPDQAIKFDDSNRDECVEDTFQ